MLSVISPLTFCSLFFFFNDTATTEIYTLSLHDALPIRQGRQPRRVISIHGVRVRLFSAEERRLAFVDRSEEHTSELQSRENLVCRLLLEKKKKKYGSFFHCIKKKTTQ